jgi:protein-S-isoprenylcysteine O-methyltransferase Ste14
MSAGGLIFNGMVTLYFWIGSVYEEKKLAREYGAAYEAYCRRVPRPWN